MVLGDARLAGDLRLLGRAGLRGRGRRAWHARHRWARSRKCGSTAQTYEPTYRVIGGERPRLCGSGLISLLAEMFITGVIDKRGNLNREPGARQRACREGEHGAEYVVAWADETAHGQDIVLTEVDIDNLLRAKAAIYAGYTVLCQSVGVDPGRCGAGADRRRVRPVHQRRKGGPDRPAARPALGTISVPGQHGGQGRVHGAAPPQMRGRSPRRQR